MSKKKKRVIACLCLVACLSAIPIPQANAACAEIGNQNTSIAPLFEYISGAECKFNVSDGTAVMIALLNGSASKATKCKITVELQEKGWLFWDTVETWTTTEYDSYASLYATYPVVEGKSYRTVTTVTVWSGTDSETQTITSDSIKA